LRRSFKDNIHITVYRQVVKFLMILKASKLAVEFRSTLHPDNKSPIKTMNQDINQLESALAFTEEDAIGLSRVLHLALAEGAVTYSAVAAEVPEPEDSILAAWQWRMLIPAGSDSRNLAWENAVLSFAPYTLLRMPLAVQLTVEQATLTGYWEPHRVLGDACPILEGRPAKTAAELLRQMRFTAQDSVISARNLGGIMKQLRLRGSLDQLIIELKAAGAISPYLTSTLGTFSGTSPQYEINPSLLRGLT